ncbi:hypothetical protein [Nocardia terpenica]|uniref:Uncharacterized protein n=1 Tax=Nocardia terpenica TaxID=455432 RepID=A0A164PWJ4_9NOCA|nr:hypothetical protein [Nocardia terpenica]KZM76171.1 hypothetical protein AWN90_00115 [Nocardia terpenica]NQE90359.1 hypothetical protein [Nocardia terpenica]
MAIKKGQRFPIPFDIAFPQGAALIGEIEKVMKFNERRRQYTDEQDTDEETRLPKWKARLMDLSEGIRGTDSGIDLVFLAPVQPVPQGQEVLPGVRPVVLENLMVQPRATLAGQFPKLIYSYFATGIAGDTSGAKQAPANPGASRPARGDEKVA